MNKTKWLALATSNDRESLSEVFIGDEYKFATDGFRIHSAGLNSESDKPDFMPENVFEVVKKFSIEIKTEIKFNVNPVYLTEALLAWADNAPDQPVTVEYYENDEDGTIFIRISNNSYDDERQAIIMCMLLPEKEAEPLPEKTQKLNENAKESESLTTDNRL